MATSYQGFWLIVGMTVAAVVIANATSTKHGAPSYSSSAKSVPASSGNSTAHSSSTASYQPSRQTSVPPPPSASLPSASTSLSQPPVTRSIDLDIRKAFDDAMKVALAVHEPQDVEVDDGESNDAAAASPLSPRGVREVSSSPKIFDETANGADQTEGASHE